jgi:hypothetical protein
MGIDVHKKESQICILAVSSAWLKAAILSYADAG